MCMQTTVHGCYCCNRLGSYKMDSAMSIGHVHPVADVSGTETAFPHETAAGARFPSDLTIWRLIKRKASKVLVDEVAVRWTDLFYLCLRLCWTLLPCSACLEPFSTSAEWCLELITFVFTYQRFAPWIDPQFAVLRPLTSTEQLGHLQAGHNAAVQMHLCRHMMHRRTVV